MMDENGATSHTNKKRRLNHACERCRSKKTRCDDRHPECTNCYKAGANCVTCDPRNPSAIVVRHEAQLPPASTHASDDVPVSTTEDTPASAASVGSSVRRNNLTKEVEDAIQPPGQGRATAKLPVFPRFVNGNSLYILTQWLDLAFVRLNHSSRFSHLYKETASHSGLPLLPDEDIDAILDDTEQRQGALDIFLNTVYRVFQVETVGYWEALMAELNECTPVRFILRALILALSDHPKARASLGLAFSRVSVMIQYSNIESLMALFLMIVAFRGFDDSHTAVHLLSIANSIAHGLILQSLPSQQDPSVVRIWWCLYAIDKALAIELERKPIVPMELGQVGLTQNETLAAIVRLARVQEIIVNRVSQEREMEDAGDQSLNDIIIHKMRSAGELDELLLNWEMKLPRDMRVTDHPCADEDGLLGMIYLALQYHQSLFAIHRNSLITNAKHIRSLADEAFSDKSYKLRLRNGALICYSTAKSIITLISHVVDQGMQSPLDTTYSLLTAAIGLAIYTYKHPNTSLVHSDLQLLSTAIGFIETRASTNVSSSRDQSLGMLLRALHADLIRRVNRYQSRKNRSNDQPEPGADQPASDASTEDTAYPKDLAANIPGTNDGSDLNIEQFDFASFDDGLFTDDIANWPNFLELFDLSSPLAAFTRNPL